MANASRSHFARTARLTVLALALAGGIGLAPLGLGIARGAEPSHITVSSRSMGSTQAVKLEVNKSLIIDLPVNVSDVIVSQPSVAAAVMRSKTRAIIQGVSGGDTNIIFLDSRGTSIAVLDIKVFQQRSEIGNALETAIARNIPDSNIRVESVTLDSSDGTEVNRVVLSGSARSQDDVARALAMATQFAGDEKNVASIINVVGSQQVMLKVTVAEIQREAIKQLGINLNGSYNNGTISTGLITNLPLGGATNVVAPNVARFGVDYGNFSLDASLRALERHGALRTLAEPTLTATSGTEAEFLAGGEFPVPTNVDEDGTITYTFKEFGVKLKFTPTIKSSGMIGLVVDTSVTEPTTEGGFSAGPVTIPATRNRQAKTTVEMGGGQTLAIGGLMEEDTRQQINRMPFLGDIPILGTLFRSRDYIRSQTELVILVTPYYTEAGAAPTLPTEKMHMANDAEAIFLGHVEKTYGVGPGGMRGSYSGSVGFVLD